jgi:hypothetical protein
LTLGFGDGPGLCGSGDEHLAARSTDAAQRIPVDRRGRAAASALSAIFGFVEVGLLDSNRFPIDVEFIGDDHRQAGLYALANLGILTHDGDGAVGSYADEGEWKERRGRRLRRRRLRCCGKRSSNGLEMISEQKAASRNGGDTKKSAAIEERGVHGTS